MDNNSLLKKTAGAWWSCLLLLGVVFFSGCGGGDSEVSSAGINANASSDDATKLANLAGHYAGTFGGDDAGTFSADISANGGVSGSGFSRQDGNFSLAGSVTPDGEFHATGSGQTNIKSYFNGTIDHSAVSGTWTNPYWEMAGGFSGQRQ